MLRSVQTELRQVFLDYLDNIFPEIFVLFLFGLLFFVSDGKEALT